MKKAEFYHSHVHSKLDSLTGIRFFAAAMVFMFHASLTRIIGFNPYADSDVIDVFQRIFSGGGWLGVSFFFVLSGFVITWSARKGDSLTGFWKRRLLKIYPNHIATWLLAMLLFSVPAASVAIWLPNLLLVHSWIPRMDTFLSVNGPSWSLCCEMFFYLLFPLALKLVWNIAEQRLWRWAWAMVAGLALTQVAIRLLAPATPLINEYPISLSQWWWAYYFPPARLFEFVLGMLMARILMAGRWIDLSVPWAFALLVGSYVAAMYVPFQYSLNLVTLVPVAALITAIAASDLKDRKGLLNTRWMVWLGEISFGFYMIHLLIMTLATQLLGGRLFDNGTATLIVVLTFALSIFGGWLLFNFIERPVMQRWGRTGKARVLGGSLAQPEATS
ncbi:acyltransferase family protein [Pseudomonas chlororaphis]|jgi:peptidoglycan/LPS O-acetylase OafA/YrhL